MDWWAGLPLAFRSGRRSVPRLAPWRTGAPNASAGPAPTPTPALFLNTRGGRLSARGAYDLLVAIAEDANLEIGRDADFTPQVLRHSAGTAMIRGGEDIVTVAELLGHSVETADRYSLPTHQDKERAIRPPYPRR